MPERIVINTGPLLALSRGGVLDLGASLGFEFVCPPEVRAELDAGEQAGLQAIRPAWLRTIELARPPDPVARATLDDAEAAVIQLAVEQGIARVCIAETKARHAALAAGLSVTGTLGLLLLAKNRGLLRSLRPVVEEIVSAGAWYDPKLIERILSAAGE
jgi:predicted nucleic acid-binding protein